MANIMTIIIKKQTQNGSRNPRDSLLTICMSALLLYMEEM